MSLFLMIANSQIAAIVCDPRLPDNPIVECNDTFLNLTGYSREEVIGRNCRFLAGVGTEPWLSESLRTSIRKRQPVMVEITNYRKNGTPFRNAVMIAPIYDDSGELQYFLGSQVEVPGDVPGAGDVRRRDASERIRLVTPRQRQILQLMAAGRLNKQIAFELGLSERTVKMHRAAVLKSLGVKTNSEAIRLAIEAGF